MPRNPGVYSSRGWWVTKAGCGDGPRKLVRTGRKSDREARRQVEEVLRKLLVEWDEGRDHPRPESVLRNL